MAYVWTAIALAAVYLGLSGNLALNNILAGLLIGGCVAWLVRPTGAVIPLRRVPAALWALVQYAGLLAYDIIRSGIAVAAIVLNPRLPIRPGILAIPAESKTELGIALYSHALSVTPGELVVGVEEEGTLYVHCLDATHAEETIAAAQSLRRRLLRRILE